MESSLKMVSNAPQRVIALSEAFGLVLTYG